MELFLICLTALTASCLTLFSGFGLGTILLPVFALFFPLETAVAVTAIVHFLNNLFKLKFFAHHADFKIVLRFGIPAVIAAFFGAKLLQILSGAAPFYTYSIGSKLAEMTLLKIVIALLLVFFALLEIFPVEKRLKFDSRFLPAGGFLSGFFGGLSGNQGAFRSAFLAQLPISKEAFIGTGVVIACLIDFMRIYVYSATFLAGDLREQAVLILAAAASAFLGVYAGAKLVHKVTMAAIQKIVAILLVILAAGIGSGIL